MSISRVEMDVPDAVRVEVSDDARTGELSDARTISVPLAWYPCLLHGQPEEQRNWAPHRWRPGIQWDNLDEDVSVEGARIRTPGRELAQRPPSPRGRGD